MKRILIIQTAFIGDVILATPLIEKLADLYPNGKIDFLLRKGSEELLSDHPKLNKVFVWDKRKNKYPNLLKIILSVRKNEYDLVVNAHRFTTSGLITWLSNAKMKVGFDKNPFSFCYNHKLKHEIGNNTHEVDRNLHLLDHLGRENKYMPKLYFSESDQRRVDDVVQGKYVTLAPASVWSTKQLPKEKWIEVINKIPIEISVCMIGGANDLIFCEKIISECDRENAINLAGKLSMLESAALMKGSLMNFVNDSAPMHIASSVNTPTRAFFCSTIPEFGFGPLAADSAIFQVEEKLSCRPCGLHGKRTCPEGHFNCGHQIDIPKDLL